MSLMIEKKDITADERLYDIAAFCVPKHRSILYKSFLTREQLLDAIEEALSKGANVISIRMVIKEVII